MKQADLLAALREIYETAENPHDAYTVSELASMLNMGEASVRRRLRAAANAGRLEVVSKRSESISGKNVPSPAYRIF